VNFREKEKQVLDQILGPGRYDARIRPSGANGTGEGTTYKHTRKHKHTLTESVQEEPLQTTVPRSVFRGQVQVYVLNAAAQFGVIYCFYTGRRKDPIVHIFI
jgi:hypothetical protein